MDDVGGLRDFCAGLALGLARTDLANTDAVFPPWQHRDCCYGGAGAPNAWSGVSRVPGFDEHVRALVPQEKARLKAALSFSSGLSFSGLALAGPEKRRQVCRTPEKAESENVEDFFVAL